MTRETEFTDEAARWTDLAADYEMLAEPFTRQYARAALAMVGGIGPGTRVLDVAAGTGALSLLAAEAGARVLATDLSPGMVARLSERLAAFPGCAARVMDGQALDTPDGAFDATFSIFGVMLFPDWRRGLRELARATRAGGRGCMAVWYSSSGAGPMSLLVEAMRSAFPDRDPPAVPEGMAALNPPGALASEMAAVGFSDVEVRTVEGAWTWPSAGDLVSAADRLFRFAPDYAALDRDERDRLRPALREAAERCAAESEVRVQSMALVAVGRRQ